MKLTSFLEDGKLTVILTGEIDHHCARDYIDSINAKIEAYVPHICVLDFGEVTFMDSSGIAVIINALRCMNKIDGKLFVRDFHEQPQKVFLAAGLNKLINVLEEHE